MLLNEEGNTVIEATFVVTICIIVVFVLLVIGFIFYQENLLQSVANQTANGIARTYPYSKKDPVTGYIGENNLADQGLFESAYWFQSKDYTANIKVDKKNGESFKSKLQILSLLGNKKVNHEAIEAVDLANKLTNKRRLYACQYYEYNVEIKQSDEVMFQNEITVSIEEHYYIPFIKLLGLSNDHIIKKYSGSALCVDIEGSRSFHNVIAVIAKNLSEEKTIKTIRYKKCRRILILCWSSMQSKYRCF